MEYEFASNKRRKAVDGRTNKVALKVQIQIGQLLFLAIGMFYLKMAMDLFVKRPKIHQLLTSNSPKFLSVVGANFNNPFDGDKKIS